MTIHRRYGEFESLTVLDALCADRVLRPIDVKASDLRSDEVELGSCYGIDVVYCGALFVN